MKHKLNTLLTIFLACCALTSIALVSIAETTMKEAVCHVCRVHDGETEAEAVVASAEHEGHTYGFCSVECRDTFVKAPVGYLPPVFPRPAPSFVVRDLEGADFSFEELRGRVVLLDFWATWCPPCVKDLPDLAQLHARHAAAGLTVMSVSTDEGKGAVKKVAKMVKKRKATHPVYLDSTDSPAWESYQVQVVPAQFLIDRGGNVVAQWSGKIDLAEVEAEILRLLEADSVGP